MAKASNRSDGLFLFDLPWDNEHDWTGKTVVQRRDRLEQIITPVPGIQVGSYLEKRGVDLFRLAKEKGLEGSSRNVRPVFTNRESDRQIG